MWVRALPFDQETRVQVVPPWVGGEGALGVLRELTMTVRANGGRAVVALNPSVRPVGFERTVSVVVAVTGLCSRALHCG